jgi:hypothetical protein
VGRVIELESLLMNIAWNLITLGVVSPVPVLVLCVLYFVVEVDRMHIGFKLTTGRFLGRILLWAAIAFAIAFVVVIALTALYNSPQGPFALILYGPLAISCGIVIGTVRWCMQEAKRPPPSTAGAPG